MNQYRYRIILCEGETDQILLGYYLSQLDGWEFFSNKETPFPGETVNWFQKDKIDVLGIWQVGGCDFENAAHQIAERAYWDATIHSLAVVTLLFSQGILWMWWYHNRL